MRPIYLICMILILTIQACQTSDSNTDSNSNEATQKSDTIPDQKTDNAKDLLEEAYLLFKNGQRLKAAAVIDKAVATADGSVDARAWHVRGFIYKDIYIKEDSRGAVPTARELAIESMKKSIENDQDKLFAVQSYKVLKLLAVSYFNEAIDIIEAQSSATIDGAEDQYLKYKDLTIYQFPDSVMTEDDIAFYLAMSTVHRKIFEKNKVANAKNYNKEQAYLKRVLELDPDNSQAKYSISVSQHNRGL